MNATASIQAGARRALLDVLRSRHPNLTFDVTIRQGEGKDAPSCKDADPVPEVPNALAHHDSRKRAA